MRPGTTTKTRTTAEAKTGKTGRQRNAKKPHQERFTLRDLTYPDHRIVHFPQVKGKTAEAIELLTSAGHHAITVAFQDKTALSFAIQPGFTVSAAYNDRSNSKPRVKRWPKIESSNLAADDRGIGLKALTLERHSRGSQSQKHHVKMRFAVQR